jgi:hypothetical protein
MDAREQKRKEKLARRMVAEKLRLYFAGLHADSDPDPLMDRVKQMLLEKDVQNELHV